MGLFDSAEAKVIRAEVIRSSTACMEIVCNIIDETSKNASLLPVYDIRTSSIIFLEFIAAHFISVNKAFNQRESVHYKLKELLAKDAISYDLVEDARKATFTNALEDFIEILAPFIYSRKGAGADIVTAYTHIQVEQYMRYIFKIQWRSEFLTELDEQYLTSMSIKLYNQTVNIVGARILKTKIGK